MTREREPPERRGRSVVRLTHPCGSTRTVEHRSRRQQILLVTGVGAAGVTAALSAAFGPFGLAAGAMASLALLYRIWRHGRGLEVIVDDDSLTLPGGVVLPRGTGHLLVEAEERTYKSSVIFEWSVSHSSVGLIASGGERPLVVRAAVEGLAVAGRWPVIWRTVVGDEERRGVSSLDVPLAVREAQEPSIPLDRRRPPEALYEEEALPGGGVLLRYVGGWSGRWHTPAFSQFAVWGFLVGVALTVFGFWAAALPIVPLLLLGPLTTPDIEVDRAGVTLRRRWGRFVLRTRRWLASRIESLYIDTLPGTRVVAVGDRFYQPLAHGKSADEVEWLRAVILRTLLGGERQEPAASATAVVEEADERFGPCPACAAPALEHVGGELDEHRCPFCAGRFLPQEGTERLVEGELGVTRDMLRELARYFGGERRTCPSCRSSTSAVRLKGVTADLCQGCGGLWLDPGELAQLSAGRYEG